MVSHQNSPLLTLSKTLTHSFRFLTSYGFDGVDIAYEFPDEEVPADRIALTTFIEEIDRQRRLMNNAIVTLTVAPFVDHLRKVYDVSKIEK